MGLKGVYVVLNVVCDLWPNMTVRDLRQGVQPLMHQLTPVIVSSGWLGGVYPPACYHGKMCETSNSGWFRPADPRINRFGRPSKRLSGQLSTLTVPLADLVLCLSRLGRHPVIANMPPDAEIVAIEQVPDRSEAVLTIRSAAFEEVKAGPIPPFEPRYDGLRWRRGR